MERTVPYSMASDIILLLLFYLSNVFYHMHCYFYYTRVFSIRINEWTVEVVKQKVTCFNYVILKRIVVMGWWVLAAPYSARFGRNFKYAYQSKLGSEIIRPRTVIACFAKKVKAVEFQFELCEWYGGKDENQHRLVTDSGAWRWRLACFPFLLKGRGRCSRQSM